MEQGVFLVYPYYHLTACSDFIARSNSCSLPRRSDTNQLSALSAEALITAIYLSQSESFASAADGCRKVVVG